MNTQAKTSVQADGHGYRITLASTGESVLLEHVGRCWRLFHGSGFTTDIAGGEESAEKIIRYVRRALARRELPILDVHCTGW